MKWMVTRTGEKAHAIVDGGPLCGVSGAIGTIEAPDHSERCGNCDKEWRRRGREKKRPHVSKQKRADYKPRR